MPKRSSKLKRPRDTKQRAKLLTDVVTVEVLDQEPVSGKDPAAVALGRKGGLKGGKARALKLSSRKKSEIARKAAATRWENVKKRRANAVADAHRGKRRHVIRADHED